MSRFKELRRIEDALKNHNAHELRWASEYVATRIQFARTREQQKYWQSLARRVEDR
jgi:hypothetical protein